MQKSFHKYTPVLTPLQECTPVVATNTPINKTRTPLAKCTSRRCKLILNAPLKFITRYYYQVKFYRIIYDRIICIFLGHRTSCREDGSTTTDWSFKLHWALKAFVVICLVITAWKLREAFIPHDCMHLFEWSDTTFIQRL